MRYWKVRGVFRYHVANNFNPQKSLLIMCCFYFFHSEKKKNYYQVFHKCIKAKVYKKQGVQNVVNVIKIKYITNHIII